MTNICDKDDYKFCKESKSIDETTNLMKALFKVITFLLLKLVVKYSITSKLKFVVKESSFVFITIFAKTLTIALCKAITRMAIFPVFRTAIKVFLILSLKAILKPVSGPVVKMLKNSVTEIQIIQYITKAISLLFIKIIIKTIVIKFLILAFQTSYISYTLDAILIRVTIILTLKTIIKESMKPLVKNKNNSKKIPKIKSTRKIVIFIFRKVITKLLKLPLIKMLL
jgi:hypothetical protein